MASRKLPKGWEEVELGTVLTRIKKPVEPNSSTMYREIGIRSHGKGIFHKEERSGKSIGKKSVFWVEPNCFIVNIVFAWEQAVAKTTRSEKGMIASHRFPMYKPLQEKLDLDYLVYFFNSPRGKYLLGLASPGGAGRNKTLGQVEFLKIKIPLPPYNQQRQIVSILGAWDNEIALSGKLISAKKEFARGLTHQLINSKIRFSGFAGTKRIVRRIRDLAEVNPQKTKLSDEVLVSFISMSGVSNDASVISQTIENYRDVKLGYTPFANGDVIVAKITPCFENGKGALVCDLRNGVGFGSTEFIVIRAKRELVNAKYLFFSTLDYDFRRRGVSNMTGSAGQKRVPVDFVKNYQLTIPSLEEQEKIANTIGLLRKEVDLNARKLSALKQQKKGLMQKLLTGQIRVKV